MSKAPNLDEVERKVRDETRRRERDTLSGIERLLNEFLKGFKAIGQFTPTPENRLERVWILIIGRSFNSLRWAYELLQTGYYSQAFALVRSVEEDWLVCKDCDANPQTIDALLDGVGRVPNFRDMAQRLPEALQDTWAARRGEPEGIYDVLSTFAHPRARAMRIAFDHENNRVRVGPSYDEGLFLLLADHILTSGISISEFFERLAPDWGGSSRLSVVQYA